VLHPGEKRILDFLARECANLPAAALVMLERLPSAEGGVLEAIDAMIAALDDMLRDEGLLPSGEVCHP
jgi:hypothetical protein